MSCGNKEDNSKEKERFPEVASSFNSTVPNLHSQDSLQICSGTLPPTFKDLPASFADSTNKGWGNGKAVCAYTVEDRHCYKEPIWGRLKTVFNGQSSKRRFPVCV